MCGRHGNMCDAIWQHVRGDMATCARRYGNMCEATWQHVRGDMATCARRYGNMCEAIWQHVRGDMATCVSRHGNMCEANCTTDDTLSYYWLDLNRLRSCSRLFPSANTIHFLQRSANPSLIASLVTLC
ncbi:hypothetical protein J6590_092982 [Homalodisca vitripennis]|nr:hypothetical protein J6590_092982 [Homalodisca vitripennis]